MMWTSVIVVVISTAVAQDFYPDRTYGAETRPLRDRLYGSQRRVLDRTYQGTRVANGHNPHVRDRQYRDQIDAGYGQSRSRKVLHKPVVDTGYIGQKPVHHEYVKPALNGHLDSEYVKPNIASPLDTDYVEPKLVDPLTTGYVHPKVTRPLDKDYVEPKLVDPFTTGYVHPKVTSPLGKDYVEPKIPGPGDVGYVDPSLLGGPMAGELIDPMIGQGQVHPTPPVGPFYGERANIPGVSTSDFVAVETEDIASLVRRNDLRDPSWNGSPRNPLDQGFPEQRRLPSTINSERLPRQRIMEDIALPVRRNDLTPRNPIDQGFPEQRRLPSTINSERLTRPRNMEDIALPVRRNNLRDPSWDRSPRNPLDQGFPEQRRLQSTIQSERLARQRNNVPFDQGFSQSRQGMLPLPSKPIPPPLTKKTVTTKNIRKSPAEKRRYYQSLREFRG